MGKTFLVIIMVVFVVLPATAGGLLSNSSQSAQYVRMLSRNASAQTDAVYYNPAGLTRLADGWHFAMNNESFLQNKTLNCGFPLLNNSEYNGKITTLVLPSAFAVIKTGDWAFSLSFGLNANGGPGNFERGLPSFEIPISKLVPYLSDLSNQNYDVTNYDAKLSFEGSSVFQGIQIGATYQINYLFSVYCGARYLHGSNNYRGFIRDVRLNVNDAYQKASVFLSFVGNKMKTTAQSLSKTAGDLQSFITEGAGNLTLNQLLAANYIDIEKKEALIKGLVDLGIITANGNMSVSQVQSAYDREAIQMNARGNILNSKATSLKDKEINTRQTGSGFTPVLGINFSPSEKLNLTARYEYKTSLKLKNNTNGDDLGVFPDGVQNNSDIPALLAAGLEYQPDRKIEAQFSYNLFFDREVDWGYNFRDNRWCRCLETGQLLALGKVTPLPALDSFFSNPERERKQTSEVLAFIKVADLSTPLVLVTHQVNITALTGVFPGSGEIVVARSLPEGKLHVVGRLSND